MSAAPAKTVEWCLSHRAALVEQAKHWMEVGALVLPVIPVVLDRDLYPKKRKNKKTGVWEVIEKHGIRMPQFGGKAPSYWDFNGNPKLIARKHLNAENICTLWSQERVLKALGEPHPRGYAAEIGSPIGFAILPTKEMPVVDLDVKENSARLIQKCHEGGHYFETTPSGGVHVILRVKDAMASWSHETLKGESTYTNWGFTHDPTLEHQGEVLCLGKVCLMAPTMRGDGNSYAAGPEPLNNTAASCVSNLTDGLGIIPIASQAQRTTSPTKGPSPTAAEVRQLTANSELTEVPDIQALVGKKAKEFLAGDLSVYGDPSDDRSGVLTSIAKEIYGTENWLLNKGLPFDGSADELIGLAVDILGSFDDAKDECIEDKADRILSTVGRDTCDIRDEDKRQKSYDYLTRANRQTSKPGTIGTTESPTKRMPFVMRGYTPDSIIFAVEETGLETAIKCASLTNAQLLPLAPKQWWSDNYGFEDDRGNWKISWQNAADDILRARSNSSVYDPSGMRGVGIWKDEGKTVVHTGGRLLVDGVDTPFAHHESDSLYVKQPRVKGPSEVELTDDETAFLQDLILHRWNWAERSGPYFVMGWLVTSMLSGALDWRPNIWLTGPTEAGKSSALDEILKPLITPVGGRLFSSETTAAGIRQDLGHSAVPVVIDELESDDDKQRRRTDDIIVMMRGSSSGSGAVVAKGTTSGTSISYLLRSSFAMASINVGLDKAQDLNRTKVIPLNPLTAHQRSQEAQTVELWEKVTPELGRKLLTKVVRLLPVIEHNAKQLKTAIIKSEALNCGARIAKVDGLLLAGSLVFSDMADDYLTESEAAEYVELCLKPETTDEVEAVTEEHSDSRQCLQHLLLHQIKVVREVRMDGFDRRENTQITVQAACDNWVRPGAFDLTELQDEMYRHGLKFATVEGEACLLIANTHAGAKAIYEKTGWRSHHETLRREGAGGKVTGTQSFGGSKQQHRCTRFPLSTLVEEQPSPTKVEPKKLSEKELNEELSQKRWATKAG